MASCYKAINQLIPKEKQPLQLDKWQCSYNWEKSSSVNALTNPTWVK